MKPKIIHTKTFSCENDHPIVWYTFDNKIDSTKKTDKGYVVCEYCYDKFVYEPKKTRTEEVLKILEENKITNVGENTPYSKEGEAMEISRSQSKKNKEERAQKLLPLKDHYIPGVTEEMTHSEEMQDELEPIPCPMHEDYDK